ncbi:MAG TPA: TMEM175 family protein, partial [Acidimicrobiales bacterium]
MTEETGTAQNGQPNPVLRKGRLRYARSGRGLEFDRVANFSDAVYAIALTLIAVELHPPALQVGSSPTELLHELGGMSDQIIIFFVVFALTGSYWLANHRFVAGLRGINTSYVSWMLPYLAGVAFLPFPAALMGHYFENPVAVSLFAVNMAVVSFLEWVLLRQVHADDLFLQPLSPAGYR